MTRLNSFDIAKKAGVSRSTVSRVINNYDNVPKETKEKVMAVINEYGYKPNASARNLAGKSNNIIGLYIYDKDTNDNESWVRNESPYNTSLISNIIIEGKKENHMILVNIISDNNDLVEVKRSFDDKLITGAIFSGFPCDYKPLLDLVKSNYNCVFIDQIKNNKNTKSIDTCNYNLGYAATVKLIEAGHKNIFHIKGDDKLCSIERFEGYKKAMQDNNLTEIVVEGNYKESVTYQNVRDVLENKKITACFSGNDVMALGLIKRMNELNLVLKDDVSIIGVDNLEKYGWFNHSLSSYETDMKLLAKECISLIFKEKNEVIKLEQKFIERNSV